MNSPHRPKKYLGQHFLTDTRIQQKIIQACGFGPEDVVVEIGPGQGVLTQLIAPLVQKLICVEADGDLIRPLRAMPFPNVEIIHADFLQWGMVDLPRGAKVIGNIPYYISTPIIEKLIADRAGVTEVFLTVQREFGERLAARPGGKDYGSLSCFAQYYADIKILFKINNSCFKPSPKVESCFLQLIMKSQPQGGVNEEQLFRLIQTAFQQRRKNIVNSLKGLAGREKLEQALQMLGINANARAENLTLSNYIELCKRLML